MNRNARNLSVVCGILAIFALGQIGQNPARAQAGDAFAKAVSNMSTSPSYVLVTIVNDRAKKRQLVCTVATFLVGAVHREYHLPYTEEGSGKAEELILGNKTRTYHFSEASALANVQPRYSPKILAEVQYRLRSVSTPDLAKKMAKGTLAEIYTKSGNWGAYRDALAHVLLERGISVGQADMTGGLYLIRSSQSFGKRRRLFVGSEVKGLVPFHFREGQMMVPFRPVMDALCWKVTWEGEKGMCTASAPHPNPDAGPITGEREPFFIRFRIGNTQTRQRVRTETEMFEEIDVHPAPLLVNGRAFVPLGFLNQQLRAREEGGITYDEKTRAFYIPAAAAMGVPNGDFGDDKGRAGVPSAP